MSAQAKTFIDRMSDLLVFRKALGRQLRGKSLAVVCAGTDAAPPSSFNQPFALTCGYLGMRFLDSHYAQFVGRSLASPTALSEALRFGSALVDAAANPAAGIPGVRRRAKTLTDAQLRAYESKRDLAAELLDTKLRSKI